MKQERIKDQPGPVNLNYVVLGSTQKRKQEAFLGYIRFPLRTMYLQYTKIRPALSRLLDFLLGETLITLTSFTGYFPVVPASPRKYIINVLTGEPGYPKKISRR